MFWDERGGSSHSPKCSFVMATDDPACTRMPVLLTSSGVSSSTGMTRTVTMAGTLVLVSVRATRVKRSRLESLPLWTYCR